MNKNQNTLKIHRPLVMAVADIVKDIMFDNRYADKAIEFHFKKNPKWGARDRSFVAESVYELVRWWRKIAFEAGVTENHELHLKKILTRYFKTKFGHLPDFEDTWDFTPAKQKPVVAIEAAINHSVPDWLFEVGSEELGQKAWEKELDAMNQQGEVCLRINTLKADLDKIIDSLENNRIEIDPHPYFPEVPVLRRKANIFATEAFKNGWIEIQDAGSQQIASFLAPTKGSRVIDACAGAGGKTLHLSNIMQNSGQIIALDTEAWKLTELKLRARRAGAGNIEIRHIDSSKVFKKLENSADFLLLDVPCSGLGVLKRNPDAKWKLKPEFLQDVKTKQAEILTNYSKMLKPNGVMVYATCSLLPSENQVQIEKFLSSEAGKNFEKVAEQTFLPSTHLSDGFFMCKLRRLSRVCEVISVVSEDKTKGLLLQEDSTNELQKGN